jgi:hypothetical protein
MIEFIKLYEDDKYVEYSFRMERSRKPGIVRFDKETLEYEIIKEDGERGTGGNIYYCNHIRARLREYKNKGEPFPARSGIAWT